MDSRCIFLAVLVLFACTSKLEGKKDNRKINCDGVVEDICKLAAVNNLANFAYFDGCNDCQCTAGQEEGNCTTINNCDEALDSKDQKYCYKVNKRIHKSIKKANKKRFSGKSKYVSKGGEKGEKGFKSYCNKKVNCSEIIKPETFCNDSNTEFQFYDGCNECVCFGKKAECTNNKCPTPATKDQRASYKCQKLHKRIKDDLMTAKSHEIECFANKTTICEDYPSGSYYDGCNNCMCNENGNEECTMKICHFFGTTRQYKKFCKANAKVYKTEEDWESKDGTAKDSKNEKDD